ncbi:MAG: hypothetical protein K8S18_08465 [Desulfobacula sp.]|nr:hypothetical protein [Desulfobacula sp.]
MGQVATGENFYPRNELIKELWSKLESGHHVLITAPRRVGKTSVLRYMYDNPVSNYKPVFIMTESVNNGNEFFRKIFIELVKKLSKYKQIRTQLIKLIKSNRITSISPDGLITIINAEIDYYSELFKIFDQIDLKGEKIIFIIDEFAQTVENIIEDESHQNAKSFLRQCREIRHHETLKKKLLFIFAGSIGLDNIVAKINATSTVNDLYPFHIPPFTKNQAKGIITKLLRNPAWKLSKEFYDHIFNTIEWQIPYYLQKIIVEIDKIKDVTVNEIDEGIIDIAVENAIKQRIYFEYWLSRLRKAFKGSDFKFAKEILNNASQHQQISSNIIADIAQKYEIQDSFQDIVNALKHDGYLNNSIDPKLYRFNSPLLRIWWNNNVNF